MKRMKTTVKIEEYPREFRPLLQGAAVYDSSCSPEAKVLFIDKDNGYYLKTASKGTLEQEAVLTQYFYQKGLAPAVLSYHSADRDWLLTARIPGEDCTTPAVLAEPERLCDWMAEQLRRLHALNPKDCPVNQTERYLRTAEKNFKNGNFDLSFAAGKFQTAEEAWDYIQTHQHLLETNTLLHGDYCLPNLLQDQWKFSGFIDLGNGGIGDRHVDLFWGAWTLNFNLKTDRYRARFFDAYGRNRIDEERLELIAAIEIFG